MQFRLSTTNDQLVHNKPQLCTTNVLSIIHSSTSLMSTMVMPKVSSLFALLTFLNLLATVTCLQDSDNLIEHEVQYNPSSSTSSRRCVQTSGQLGTCFPAKACQQWYPHHTLHQKWHVCQWTSEGSSVASTICCREPELAKVGGQPTRSLIATYVDLPKERLKQREKTRKAGKCGKVTIPNHSAQWSSRRRRVAVAGGHEAEPYSHPWLASIWYKGSFACGATVISKDAVLTAAHCVNHMW